MSSGSRSILRHIYRGDANIDFIGSRKRWYIASVIAVIACVASMVFVGFNLGVEFAGGNQFTLPVKPGTTKSALEQAVKDSGARLASVQVAGAAGQQKYVVKTEAIKDKTGDKAGTASTLVSDNLQKAGKVNANEVTTVEVSAAWGTEVTKQAGIALVVFLLLVAAYLWIRYESKMAVAAIAALLHDLVITAGVYSMTGFEVTPGTVVGLLTILGFSLYDTVVVFDKVDENSKKVLAGSRYTYPEAANLAVNQTLMRSINTSLIALMPVGGLLFVGAGLLGVGTLRDLALVLFVGMAVGTYSSLFLATPWLVDLKLTDKRYKLHEQRTLAKRAGVKSERQAKRAAAEAAGEDADDLAEDDGDDLQARIDALAGSTAPRPGQKPATRPAKKKR